MFIFDNDSTDGLYELFNEDKVTSQRGSIKKRRRCYFPSNKPQTFVVNAQTGVPYSFRVGSKEQRQLFKTVDATGICDEDGFLVSQNQKVFSPITHHLFYDTPEQCMKHLNVSFEKSFVEQWHDARRAGL
jgi:hypothetical protein